MNNGFGPYGVVGAGEILGSFVILIAALLAVAWMAYRTRRT